MTLELFIAILIGSATATSLGIEIVKEILDKLGKTYKVMPMSVVISFLVGVVEMLVYLFYNGNLNGFTFIYCLAMGFSNVLGATLSYDTVKSFLIALFSTAKGK